MAHQDTGREPDRASTPEQRLALKAAVRRALKLAGGAASFQHATRVGESDLSRCASPDQADRHLPIDVALDLDGEAGSDVVLSAMAAARGYRLVRETPGPVGELTAVDLGLMAGECGDAVRALADAMADGRFDEAERRAVHKEIEEAVAAIRRVQARVPLPGRA